MQAATDSVSAIPFAFPAHSATPRVVALLVDLFSFPVGSGSTAFLTLKRGGVMLLLTALIVLGGATNFSLKFPRLAERGRRGRA